jgi:hypothetical protein
MPQNLTPPPKGAMFLFDYITPPLRPDLYRMEVSTDVSFGPQTHPLQDEKFFEVVGPRFLLQASDVAGVFPPRNGRGPYQASLAQIVLRRRTLPWERDPDKSNLIGQPSGSDLLPSNYPLPWMGLLVFEEGEYKLLENVPLESVVPADVFNRLGRPANILCNAVEADRSLVTSIMPSREEMQLLAHVRWVNIEDRELNVEGSDGWFAVVMTNRLPRPGAKCRACLVSLEERTDLITANPPPSHVPGTGAGGLVLDLDLLEAPVIQDFELTRTRPVDRFRVVERASDTLAGKLISVAILKTRLVLLYSWQYTCEGEGTFYDLMQGLDVGLIGKPEKPGEPALTDTAHLRLELQDRSGVQESVWYRGPLVPFELTRDPLGPYHSADQARRATPETGAEDISYAAAFEVGRLLAASDARLAQELMRWRREAYKQSARGSVITDIQTKIPLDMPVALAEKVHAALVPILATASVKQLAAGAGPLADRYGISVAGKTIGMEPEVLAEVWGLASAIEAQAILGGDPGTLGVEPAPPPATKRPDATLDQVLADKAALQNLSRARDRLTENIKIKLGGQG